MLQGQRDLTAVGQHDPVRAGAVVGAQHGRVLRARRRRRRSRQLKLLASYASGGQRAHGKRVELGEGLVGQCAIEKRKILLTNVAGASTSAIATGLGEAAPRNVLVLPVVFEGEVQGRDRARLARTLQPDAPGVPRPADGIDRHRDQHHRGEHAHRGPAQAVAVAARARAAGELQQTNQELQEKARLLAHQNQEVERKNREVEQARQALEEKAAQLALTSKYKSEFLANMSHELRTPLNSLLILSDQLCAATRDGNLTGKQVEFAKTIHSSGNDLLALINDILDLSKIESGTVAVDVERAALRRPAAATSSAPSATSAESKNLDFLIARRSASCRKTMFTDAKRLQQIIKNLLSNAFKFTARRPGDAHDRARQLPAGTRDNEELNRAAEVVAFARHRHRHRHLRPTSSRSSSRPSSRPTAATSRKYGGTGLGLAISRELSRLLGGEIRLVERAGRGSTFTLYLPLTYSAAARRVARDCRPSRANTALATALDADRHVSDTPKVLAHAAGRSRTLLANEAATTATTFQPGDTRAADRRERPGLRHGSCWRPRASKGSRGSSPRSGAAALALARDYMPDAGHARHLAARHARAGACWIA